MYDEGLHVAVIAHESFQQPPTEVEVPTQRDLFLSAVGGSGEPGHIGGDGEPGMDGTEGAPATRESDATVWNDLFMVLLRKIEDDFEADGLIARYQWGSWRGVSSLSILDSMALVITSTA